MIKDKLQNAETYYGISERLKQGFEWLKTNDIATMPDGKYFIDGENLYINIQTYETKDNALYEAHREYADIQYMIDGIEKIGVTDYSNCSTAEKYSEDKDIEFLRNNTDSQYQTLSTGEFLVFYPQDAHQPSLKFDTNKTVKKAVVKVKI